MAWNPNMIQCQSLSLSQTFPLALFRHLVHFMKLPFGLGPNPRIPFRIGVVQFHPKIGQVQANITKARELCRSLEPRSMDLLCFPEMAFTGYVFDSAEAISPHLELPHTGPTSKFCKELAERLSCYVVAGYPERLEPHETSTHVEDVSVNSSETTTNAVARSPSPEHHGQKYVGANSAVLYSPSGECVLGYRKTHMFKTDVTWAKPGTGFVTVPLPFPAYKPPPSSPTTQSEQTIVNLTLGICMDLNAQPPAEWTTAEGPYELADHCVENKTNLLVLLNAWLDSGIQEDGDLIAERSEDGYEENGEEENNEEMTGPDWSTLDFWTARLWPLWRRQRGSTRTITSQSSESDEDEQDGDMRQTEDKDSHETIVVACNRTGEENGKIFAGSSAMFSMRSGSGRAKLLHTLGRREECVRIWDLPV